MTELIIRSSCMRGAVGSSAALLNSSVARVAVGVVVITVFSEYIESRLKHCKRLFHVCAET